MTREEWYRQMLAGLGGVLLIPVLILGGALLFTPVGLFVLVSALGLFTGIALFVIVRTAPTIGRD